MSLKQLQQHAHRMAKEKGFWDGKDASSIPEKLALVHSEVSEALEDYRKTHNDNDLSVTLSDPVTGKLTGFPSELADIIIRVVDIAEFLGIDIDSEIERKMEFNATRPYKHGKRA